MNRVVGKFERSGVTSVPFAVIVLSFAGDLG